MLSLLRCVPATSITQHRLRLKDCHQLPRRRHRRGDTQAGVRHHTAGAEPGHPQAPVTVKTFPAFPRQGTENDKARVIEASLRHYSRPPAEVDASLNRFLSPT